MHNLPLLFPFFFVGMFVFVIYILAQKGWSDLATHFYYPEPFEGERIGITSASINGVNYNNVLLMKCNEQGLYMKPILMFRLFHKPVLIPWNEFRTIRNKKILFVRVTELVIGDPAIAIMQLKPATVNRLVYLDTKEVEKY